MYKPKPGKQDELMKIVQKHVPLLKKYELITERPAILARSGDGTIIEIFEWLSDGAKDAAHQHPAIAQLWEAMAPVADFPAMKDLPEAQRPFPNFEIL